jgi:Omp85 superfamily domain
MIPGHTHWLLRTVLSLVAALAAPPVSAADRATIREIGEVTFLAVAPGTPTIFSAESIRGALRGEIGRPCDPPRAEESVSARYRALGYIPMVRAHCDDGTLKVQVRESSHRIALITFEPSDLGRIGLAATPVENEKTFYPVPVSAPRDLILGLLQTRPGDLYNIGRYRIDRLAIEPLGYVLLFIPGPPAEGDEFRDGAYLIQNVRPQKEDGSPRPHKLNYLGGNAGYGPRTGTNVGVTYTRSEIWQALDSITFSPTFNSEWGGDITYTAPLLAARQAPQRLYDIKVSGFSTFINNRLLDGVEQDERRNGGAVALGAKPLRFKGANALRLEAELRRESVDLSDEPGNTDLTLLRLSAIHDWRHTFLPPSFSLRTLPSLEMSFDIGNGAPFIRPGLQAYLHSRWRSGFEVDLHLSGGGLDRPVPDFELFSLGGPTTVRGFQPDTFLGRGIAALQAELWIPFARPLEARPVGVAESENPTAAPHVPRFIHDFKAALFVDGGEVWQSPGVGREGLAGAGIGLRLVIPGEPLVVRIDYGWGLGSRGGDAYPYVSLGYAF